MDLWLILFLVMLIIFPSDTSILIGPFVKLYPSNIPDRLVIQKSIVVK